MQHEKKYQRRGEDKEEEENDRGGERRGLDWGMTYTFVPSTGLWMTVVWGSWRKRKMRRGDEGRWNKREQVKKKWKRERGRERKRAEFDINVNINEPSVPERVTWMLYEEKVLVKDGRKERGRILQSHRVGGWTENCNLESVLLPVHTHAHTHTN